MDISNSGSVREIGQPQQGFFKDSWKFIETIIEKSSCFSPFLRTSKNVSTHVEKK